MSLAGAACLQAVASPSTASAVGAAATATTQPSRSYPASGTHGTDVLADVVRAQSRVGRLDAAAVTAQRAANTKAADAKTVADQAAATAAQASSDQAAHAAAAQAAQQAAEAVAAQRDAAAQAASRSAARTVPAAAAVWVLPTSGYHLTATFGSSGSHWASRHTGLDFAAPVGTPIVAVGAGTVISTGWSGPYGMRTVIEHADGTQTWYCHQSAFVAQAAQQVSAGQLIGRVGSTGNTSGPHLHLEVRPSPDTPVDPRSWLVEHGVTP